MAVHPDQCTQEQIVTFLAKIAGGHVLIERTKFAVRRGGVLVDRPAYAVHARVLGLAWLLALDSHSARSRFSRNGRDDFDAWNDERQR